MTDTTPVTTRAKKDKTTGEGAFPAVGSPTSTGQPKVREGANPTQVVGSEGEKGKSEQSKNQASGFPTPTRESRERLPPYPTPPFISPEVGVSTSQPQGSPTPTREKQAQGSSTESTSGAQESVVATTQGKLKKYFFVDEKGTRRPFKVTFIDENGREVDSVRIPVNELEKRLQEYGFDETTIEDIKKGINSNEDLKKGIGEGKVQEFEVSSGNGILVLTPIIFTKETTAEQNSETSSKGQSPNQPKEEAKKGVIARIKEFFRKYWVFLEPAAIIETLALLDAGISYFLLNSASLAMLGGVLGIIGLIEVVLAIAWIREMRSEEKAKNGDKSGGSGEKGEGNGSKLSISKTFGKVRENLTNFATSTTNFVTEKLGNAKEKSINLATGTINFITSTFKRVTEYFPKKRKKKETTSEEIGVSVVDWRTIPSEEIDWGE